MSTVSSNSVERYGEPQELARSESLRQARLLLENIGSSLSFNDCLDLSTAMEDMADVAAESGDAQEVYEWAERVEQLPDHGGSKLAKIYFLASSLGHEGAFDRLNGLLATEKEESTQKIRKQTEQGGLPTRVLVSDNLKAILEECAARELPANGWLDNYAVDGAHRNHLQIEYFWAAKRKGKDQQPLAQGALSAAVAELLKSDQLPAGYAYATINLAYAPIKDPEIRRELANRSATISNDIALSPASFDVLNRFAHTVIADSDVATEGIIEGFDKTIDRCSAILMEHGADSFTIKQTVGIWKLQLAMHRGSSPEQLASQIDQWTSELVRLDIPESNDGTIASTIRNKDHVFWLRDIYFSSLADSYVGRGDVQSAKLLISQISSDTSRKFALQRCLEATITSEDVQSLAPDEFTISTEPELAELIDVKQALLSADANIMSNKVREILTTYDPKKPLQSDSLRSLIQSVLLLDQDQGIALAREALNIVNELGGSYWEKAGYRESLINAGDASQHLMILDDIGRLESQPRQAMLYARLAKKLSIAAKA